MRIAIVGTGIAGNVAAWHLCQEHDITVFEANDYVGGHTHSHDIETASGHYVVDTGFIVFNYRTYPNFVRLLEQLGVEVQPSRMSFSVKCTRTGLEYNGTSLNALFAQRRNLLNPGFHRMIHDILRFNREAPALISGSDEDLALGDYLAHQGYSRRFIEHYIIPMGAAIWSAEPAQMLAFPARFFVRFLHNHGMLSIKNRPQWYVIQGGSKQYVERLIKPYQRRIRLNSAVQRIRRRVDHVEVYTHAGGWERFDHVFIACHSDQALRLLEDPSQEEQEVLGSIPYQRNTAVLHTDTAVLPRRKLAWAAWNYHIARERQSNVSVTYDMNILQSLGAAETFCVTLNPHQSIDESKVLRRMTYHHPVFTPQGVAAQKRHGEINGVRRTYYCGAYWRFGFHEDGVVSALEVCKHFAKTL